MAHLERIIGAQRPDERRRWRDDQADREDLFTDEAGIAAVKERPGEEGKCDRKNGKTFDDGQDREEAAFDRLAVQELPPAGYNERAEEGRDAAVRTAEAGLPRPGCDAIGVGRVRDPEQDEEEEQGFADKEHR